LIFAQQGLVAAVKEVLFCIIPTRKAPIPTNVLAMLRGLASLLLLAVILVSSSCSIVEEEPIKFSPEAFSLDGTKWTLKECPHVPSLIINGYADCDYLAQLEFRDEMVYITYNGTEEESPHHICNIDGSHLTVSIQDCSNSNWRPTFQWNVVALDFSTMIVVIEMPGLASGYKAQFSYERVK
jgi:hypothetical protein